MNTGLFNMGSLFRPKMPALPEVKPAPEPPELSAEEKARIAKEERERNLRRIGRKETILTSPLGIQESKEEAMKTLLGE